MDNLPEMVDEYQLIGVVQYCLRTVGSAKNVRYSRVSNALKSTEKRSELSVISWVSAVEGCPLSGVPL